jgi:heme exporter protein B
MSTEVEFGAGEAIVWALRRDLQIALRSRGELGITLLFFLIVVSLFPLGLNPDAKLLSTIAPGVAWVGALLATLLALPRLFAADHADGTLEQMLLSPLPLAGIVGGKVLAHWITTGLPLVLVSPLIAVQFGLDAPALAVLMGSLLLGTPILSLLGAIGAALTLGLRAAQVLLSLLVLPLFVPVLIFGAGAVDAQASGLGAGGQLSLLGAGLLFAIVLAPWATCAALRISMD